MKRILILAIGMLIGCGPKHMIGVDFNELSGFPCIDGVVFNVDKAGCEAFYWGHTKSGNLKLRCTYAESKSFYTVSSFYATPIGLEPAPEDHGTLSENTEYIPFCVDSTTMVYVVTPEVKKSESGQPDAEQ